MRTAGRGRWVLLGVLLGAAGAAAALYVWQRWHPADVRQVVKVVDGDTLALDDGQRVRLKGVSAPELHEPGGPEAKEGLRRLADGQAVELVTDSHDRTSSHRDRYGRLLAYVIRRKDGLDVNAEMLRQGLVKVTPSYPADRRAAYEEVEREARAAGRGLWSGRHVRSAPWWEGWRWRALAAAGVVAGLVLLLVVLRARRAWRDSVGGGRPWPR